MSTYLTHLTKSNSGMNVLGVLLKILEEQKLLGSNSTGFIQGSHRAVCFQDSPLTGIAQNVYHEQKLLEDNKIEKVRYNATGLMFNKAYAFNKGARPVIYEQKEVAKLKFSDELWRVVTLDLSDKTNIIDWTHEREWRIKGDFEFELEEVTVILPNERVYKKFIELVDKDKLSKLKGIVCMGPVNF